MNDAKPLASVVGYASSVNWYMRMHTENVTSSAKSALIQFMRCEESYRRDNVACQEKIRGGSAATYQDKISSMARDNSPTHGSGTSSRRWVCARFSPTA